MTGSVRVLALAVGLGVAAAQSTPAAQSYYEFGTVVAIGRGNVTIATYDDQLLRTVEHTFSFGKGSRVEVMRPGQSVEVIFTPDAAGEFILRNLVVLSAGVPKAGFPGARHGGAVAGLAASPGVTGKAVPRVNSVALPTQSPSSSRTGASRGVILPAPAAGRANSGKVAAVELGATGAKAVPGVVAVPLGAEPASFPVAPRVKAIAHADPSAECNRSDASWPDQPISIAVLDFRYPTDKEESHDIGTTGGGSGTAVADLVLERLSSEDNGIAYSRGDRDKLYRADFAGAARLGRRLGVDAVLAGTFQPVDQPLDRDGFAPPPIYELRAGLVDTCTGQLLERLSSAICPGGIDTGGTQSGCKRVSVTAKQASDPKETRRAFTPALDALLLPLEHDGTPPGQRGSAGLVSAVNGAKVTVSLGAGVKENVGDVIALHAWRLSKNNSTYTLHRLQDEEIGRLTVQQVGGGSVTGTFQGDFSPKVGDTAESVTE